MEKRDGSVAIMVLMSISLFGLVWLGGNIAVAIAKDNQVLSFIFGPVYCYLGYWVLKLIYKLISGEM